MYHFKCHHCESVLKHQENIKGYQVQYTNCGVYLLPFLRVIAFLYILTTLSVYNIGVTSGSTNL